MTEQTFDVGDSPRFVASISSGSVEVVESPAGVISLRIESSREAEFEVSHSGDTVTVRRPPNGGGWSRREAHTRLRVAVPIGSTVRISCSSADVTTEVRLNEAYIDTASGDVAIWEVKNAKVKTASGEVAIGTATGDVSLRTASGDVKVGDATGRVEISTASGSVDLGTTRGDVTSSTASGDLDIERYEGSDLDLKSASGSIRIGLPAGTKVALDANSMSGRIRLPERTPSGISRADRHQVRARLRTISGDIELVRLG
ncbi:MAG TPA: DUF4097 family beta strand repeat-containing protein [Acidimicrobiia bacterium]